MVVNDSTKLAFTLNTQANKFTSFVGSGVYFKNRIEQFVPKPNIPEGNFELRIVKLQNNRLTILHKQNINVE